MAYHKFKVTFEIDEETIKDFFDSRDIKFTKKKLAELKADMKDNDAEHLLAESLEEAFHDAICEWIENMFEE